MKKQKKIQGKILEIITQSNFGGAQKYVYELSDQLHRDGYWVAVALGGDGLLKQKLDEQNITTISIPSLTRKVNPVSDLKTFFSLIKIIRREKPDVIHLNSSKIGALGSLAGRLCFVPKIVFTIHGLALNEKRGALSKVLIKYIYWLTLLWSHKSIAVSEKIKEQLLSCRCFGIFKNKIAVVPNKIRALDFFDSQVAREKISDLVGADLQNKIVIASIAELHHIKGLNFLIEAAEKICQKKDRLVFVVFGSGSEQTKLQAQIDSLRLNDKFILLGFVQDAPRYLMGCDYFILPSISEGLPMVIEEAKQSGIPIAASRVGGIPEALANYPKSELFPAENPEAIVRSLEKLTMANPADRFNERRPATDNEFIKMYDVTCRILGLGL